MKMKYSRAGVVAVLGILVYSTGCHDDYDNNNY